MSERMATESPRGAYANYLQIGQNPFEFVFDFGQLYLEDHDARFHTRIITTPVYAKAFLRVLRDCIERYELDFGMIPEDLVPSDPERRWWD